MKDNRTAPRFNPEHFLEVRDCASGVRVGFLTNVSETGMLVHCEAPLDTNTGRVYALEIVLLEELHGHHAVAVSAVSVWFKRDHGMNLFVSGLRLVAMDSRGQSLWNAFVAKYKVGEPPPVAKRVSIWRADSDWLPEEHGFARQKRNGVQGQLWDGRPSEQPSDGAGEEVPEELRQGTEEPGARPCSVEDQVAPFAGERDDDSNAFEDVKI